MDASQTFFEAINRLKPGNVLELSPQQPLGVTTWQPATPAELETKLTARRAWLEKELSALAQIAQNPTP